MCLSGYLMAYQASKRVEDKQTLAHTLRFYIRRFFRIAPVYYFILATCVILRGPIVSGLHAMQVANITSWASPPTYDLTQNQYDPNRVHFTFLNLLLHISFTFGLVPQYAFATFVDDWSIGLEMQFYAVFPFLILAIRKYGYLALTAVLVVLANVTRHFLRFPEPSFLLLKLPLFFVGIIAADAVESFARNPRKGANLAVFSLMIASFSSFYVVGVAAVMLYLGWHSTGSVLRETLDNRFTRFLADTSYCVYLIHSIMLGLCGSVLYHSP